MSDELLRQLTGVASLIFVASLLYLLVVQLRLWPDDTQKLSATAFVTMGIVTIGQLTVAYFGGPALGTSARGVLSFGAWALTAAGLAWETHKYLRKRGVALNLRLMAWELRGAARRWVERMW